MIRNGIWDFFYLHDILLHKSIFSLDNVKRQVTSLHKGSKSDKYIAHNLTWSGAYLSSNLSSDILQKVLKLVPLTETEPEVYVVTIINIISDPYDSLVETINLMKSIKLKDHLGENAAECCDEILVDAGCLESAGTFKPEPLVYIIHILEDTSDSRFHIWETQKYKEVVEFINKFCVCIAKTSCDLMISLPMVPLFKNLCMNNTTLSTKSGGNPLIVRKFSK